MAIRETLELDISQALNQLNDLERELDGLFAPVARGDNEFESLNRELDQTVTELKQVDNQAERTGRELETAGQRGVSSFKGLTGAFLGFAGALAAFQGFALLGRGLSSAIQGAAQLEDATSKVEVVFGSFSKQILDFAKTAPQALGLANREAVDFLGTFGNLFVALGLTQEEAANLSPTIVQLGADLASFNGIPVTDALEKLRSGLVGEAEPLRAVGVNLNEAAVAVKALELGLVGANGELTEAAKVQARYALILEQTGTAQGDFARTSEGIVNTQRSLRGEFEDFKDAVGQALLPAFATLLEQSPQILQALNGLVPVISSIAQTIADTEFTGFVSGLVDIARAAINIPGVLAGIGEDLFSVGAGNQALILSRATQDLVEQIREGVDPAKALANNLADIARSDLNPEQFKETAAALLRITNLPQSRLSDLALTIKNLGPSAGLSAQEIAILLGEIDQLRTLRPIENPFVNFITTPQQTQNISDTAAAILELSLAGEGIGQFARDIGVEGLADPADAFILLTSALQAARDSLSEDEDAIVKDLGDFFEDLNRELDAQVEFQANLATLRLRRQFNLADLFEELGPQAAGLLADAVTDPAAAAAEEARLEEHARRMMRAEVGAATSELTGLIGQLEIPPVVIPLTFGGLPDIPISALTAGGVGAGGQVTVIINNPSTSDLPTDANRAKEVLASVIKNRTGGSVGGTG